MMEKSRPAAKAVVKGAPDYPEISGTVNFYPTNQGVLVVAEVYGLPHSRGPCEGGVFAFHIHEGRSCTGNEEDAFADAAGHYNPQDCEHPHHAGDLPPLFDNDGYAWSAVLTDRFTVDEILGRTVIIHRDVDDFTTQPSGAAGAKIACGVIR
ncbi:MAG: superoxide dismutase family protein [Firmicutes bacterium HGW-Firmicutes-21]|nr:MAG: superoxide dismutase family protein [Firmicutes bacterium HGW-Firmicutes-21]